MQDERTRRPERNRRQRTRRDPTDQEPKKSPEVPKKKRMRRLNRSGFRIKLLTMLGVAAAVILGFIIFFKIQTIRVAYELDGVQMDEEQLRQTLTDTENRYYSAEEIANASGIQIGDNLLTLNKAEIAARIKSALPYINQVQVKRTLPNTVTLIVTEFEVTYAISDSAGGCWLINCDGTVLESSATNDNKEHMTIQGLTIQPPQIGQIIEPAGAEGADQTELSAKKDALLLVLHALEAAPEISKQMVTCDLSASYDIVLWYGTQYEIHLGTTDEIAYKLAYFKGMLEEFSKKNQTYLSGVIDITFSEGRKASFHPFDKVD